MTEDSKKEGLGRRAFLRQAGLGVGAAGAAAVAAIGTATDAKAAAAKPAQGGYAETEHVKRYYATASRF